ncbi:sirohydrochlorin chelatase [Streptomyces boncukensis]|uniref:Sirohydrochlorin chelatase n=1 Tax=Streptomyces boncukensis TaxID=2711219 RepID=A0A6G4X8C2_9ACTN|nr:CbiX/SirB N-terminal domain-containing protein [Streptomyces boncukensis]NGO73493.1 sirohydrochlorin chelatase [Streptomyces boncukensis]
MSVLLVLHGTRHPDGARTARLLAARTAARLDRPVELAYADVRGPTVAQALARVGAGPVTVVPAFLASGYHVRVDIPEQLRAAGRAPDATVTAPLGPSPELLPALADRLAEAGVREGDAVLLAGAGTADPSARGEVAGVAARLGRLLSRPDPVPVGWAATAGPSVAEAVARLRAAGARRVAVASWLLAPGLFADRVRASGADAVAAPLAGHPAVVSLLARRARAGAADGVGVTAPAGAPAPPGAYRASAMC